MFKFRSKLIVAVIVILGVTAFMSCEKEDAFHNPSFGYEKEKMLNKNVDESAPLTLQELKDIGIKHNKALDKVFLGLKEKGVSYKDKDSIEQILNYELNEFYKNNINDGTLEVAIEQSEKAVKKFIKRAENPTSQTPLEDVIEEYSKNLSELQREFLIEINNVMIHPDGNVKNIIGKLENIRERALRELPEKESVIILVGIEVGEASLQYWSENIEKWKRMLGVDNKTVMTWFDWKELAGSDVAGAVGGATFAVVYNVIVPPVGQVAYVGTTVATAAATSATDAVMQVWNHYFD